MDDFTREAFARLPLAEAVIRLWDYVTQERFLDSVFQRYRGRSYEGTLRFASLTHLIADALLEHRGSANQAFERANENDILDVSMQAAYGKLRRIPISLSNGFLAEGTLHLRELLPIPKSPVPKSLRTFKLIVIDGKKIKNAAKRLKPVRKVKGSVLGGKVLAALSLESGLAIAMNAHPDGEANDAPLVPGLLSQVHDVVKGTKLFIEDRQFCDLTHPPLVTEQGDHFLIRYHPKVSFHRDTSCKINRGKDGQGRCYTAEWGWLGGQGNKRRIYVRRITLKRKGEEDLILVTDLLDSKTYPAVDLLTAYLSRWGIEKVFQKITEVFHLESLIASTPEGTIFQCAFCLLLYNMIEVIRCYVAQAENLKPEQISLENLFYDTHRQLIAWSELIGPSLTLEHLSPIHSTTRLRQRLTKLLADVWTPRWLKAPLKKRPPPKQQKSVAGGHTSIYRALRAATSDKR